MRHSLQGVREREHNNRGKNNKSNNNWGCIELPTLQIVGGRGLRGVTIHDRRKALVEGRFSGRNHCARTPTVRVKKRRRVAGQCVTE